MRKIYTMKQPVNKKCPVCGKSVKMLITFIKEPMCWHCYKQLMASPMQGLLEEVKPCQH